jgi:hypothetical protein
MTPLRLFTTVAIVGCVLSFAASQARAAPRFAKTDEDALADGDLDAEDLVGRATVGRTVVRSPPGGETWLSLAGFTRSTLAGEREIGGFVVVGLPLDRIAKIGTRSAMYRSVTTAALELTNVVANSTEGEAVGVTPRAARATVEAAWRAAGLGVDDARLDAIMSRARWSAALPETRLRAIRYDDERLYGDATTDPSRVRDSTGARVGLEARLTWRFDRLLYAEDEPQIERLRLDRQEARTRVAAKVLAELSKWARAQAEEAVAPLDSDARIDALLKVMEAEITLDVMTGGWFSAWKAER